MGFDDPPSPCTSVVEVVFRVSDERYPTVRISEEEDCEFELLRMLPRGDGRYGEFYTVSGADPAAVHDRAEQASAIEPRLLAEQGSHALFEFEVTGRSPASDLATMEVIPVAVETESGTGRIEAEIVPPPEPGAVIDEFQERHPATTLVEKSVKDGTVTPFTERELAQTLGTRLTDRQLEVLRAAYDAGYYERPRETTGKEIADQLDISVATFSQHVRVAEQRLLGILFEQDVI